MTQRVGTTLTLNSDSVFAHLGSEHLVGDTQYPMEMHLVHYKAVHDNIGDALREGAYDSLAVLGIFFQERFFMCLCASLTRTISGV